MQVKHEHDIARFEAEIFLLEEQRRVSEVQRLNTSSADDSMGCSQCPQAIQNDSAF